MARRGSNVNTNTGGDPRDGVIGELVDDLRKKFGDGIVFTGEDNTLAKVSAISTGSLGIDMAIGVGGLPQGRITEIYGPESSGKTTIALSVIAQAQQMGMWAAFIDMEHALDLQWAQRIGVDLNRILISQPDTGEDAIKLASEFLSSGAVGIVVLDSVAALIPTAEISGDVGDSHVGLQARLMTAGLRRISGVIKSTNSIMLFTNQLRDNIGINSPYAPKETTPGGRALKFYASVRLDVRRISTIKSGADSVGARTKVTVKKNKVAAPFRVAELDIMFDEGISLVGEIIDHAVSLNLIDKRGAYYRFGEEHPQQQGRDKARKFLMDNPDLCFELHQKILAENGIAPLAEQPKYRKLSEEEEQKLRLQYMGTSSTADDVE